MSNTFLKTVSAFANYGNGEILFGVDDDGQELGLEGSAADALRIENAINDGIAPKPEFEIEENPERLGFRIVGDGFDETEWLMVYRFE